MTENREPMTATACPNCQGVRVDGYTCPRCDDKGTVSVVGSGAEQGGQSKLSERNAATGDAPLLQQATVPPLPASGEKR